MLPFRFSRFIAIFSALYRFILAPSGTPCDIQVANYTRERINVTWSPPDPLERNGVITKYSVCVKNEAFPTCLHEDIVNFTQTSYVFNKLRPYRFYIVYIRARTVIGWGPTGSITQRTAQAGR